MAKICLFLPAAKPTGLQMDRVIVVVGENFFQVHFTKMFTK